MKRRTTPTLVMGCNIANTDIESIEFLFKQYDSEECETKVVKVYPGPDVSYDSEKDEYAINWTEEETAVFAENQDFFCDPRVTLESGKIPETNIVKLRMNHTLWSEEDIDDQVSGS